MRYFNFLEFLSFFFRPITVCCDIIYDKPNNESNKTECIQYKPGIGRYQFKGDTGSVIIKNWDYTLYVTDANFKNLPFYKIARGPSPQYLTKYLGKISMTTFI